MKMNEHRIHLASLFHLHHTCIACDIYNHINVFWYPWLFSSWQLFSSCCLIWLFYHLFMHLGMQIRFTEMFIFKRIIDFVYRSIVIFSLNYACFEKCAWLRTYKVLQVYDYLVFLFIYWNEMWLWVHVFKTDNIYDIYHA